MASIGQRLAEITDKMGAELEKKPAAVKPGGQPVFANLPAQRPGTAPGRLLRHSDELLEAQKELEALRSRLKDFDGSMPTIKLDPKKIRLSAWANRHEAHYKTPVFAKFKDALSASGGNVQPVLVVRVPGTEDEYELVFGHRRTQGCTELGLPVLAVIWDRPLTSEELFLLMERENREREDLSAYEKGRSYLRALDETTGIYRTDRQLAEAIGVSRTWIRKALSVAKLPDAIVACFESPLIIKPAHAAAIDEALKENEKAVMRRAEKMRLRPAKPSVNKVVAELLGHESEARSAVKIKMNGKSVGSWLRDSRGRTVLTFDAGMVDDASMQKVMAALEDVFK